MSYERRSEVKEGSCNRSPLLHNFSFCLLNFLVRVGLAFSCLSVVPAGEGDFRLPFADASLPFGRYAAPFVGCATFYSFPEARKLCLPDPPFCRCAFWPGFPCFPGSLDFLC